MDRIIAQSEAEFRRGVTSLRANDLAAIMSLIQREMRQEQEEFNRLGDRMGGLEEGSKDFAYFEKARVDSQSRLSSLMTKSMICLEQMSKQSTSTDQEACGPVSKPYNSASRPKSNSSESQPSKATSFVSVNISASIQNRHSLSEGKESKTSPRGNSISSSGSRGNSVTSISDNQSPVARGINMSSTVAQSPFMRGNSTTSTPARGNSVTSIPEDQLPAMRGNSVTSPIRGNSVTSSPNTESEITLRNGRAPNSPQREREEESEELRSVNARSLIANFEKLSSVDEVQMRPPRRSVSAYGITTSPTATNQRNGGIPKSPSTSQLTWKDRAEERKRLEEERRRKQEEEEDRKKKMDDERRKRMEEERRRRVDEEKAIEQEKKRLMEEDRKRTLERKRKEEEIEVKKVLPQFGAKQVEIVAMENNTNGGVVVGDEKVVPIPTLKSWDPRKLLDQMFAVMLYPDIEEGDAGITFRGIMDRLPDQKKKNTMLKTWKRRYFVAEGGELRGFDSDPSKGPSPPVSVFHLSGGRVDDLGEQMIGLDDACGRFMTLRCLTVTDHSRWLRSLRSQTSVRHRLDIVRPQPLSSVTEHSKKVVIVDIGSYAVRAGLLASSPVLPILFFPCVASMDGQGDVVAVGRDAFSPNHRQRLVHPVRAETTIENVAFERGILRRIFLHVFEELRLNPKSCTLLLSLPHTTSDETRCKIAGLVLDDLACSAVAMCGQAMLALYSYGLTTGVVLDIGHRVEVLPVTDGVVQRGGVSRQPYGGSRVAATMNLHLTERGCRFHSDAESLLSYYITQQTAFVCQDPEKECDVTNGAEKVIDLSDFELPSGYRNRVSVLASGRCRSTEGLFAPADYFGMDGPSISQLLSRAILACPMDLRRDLARRILLSGASSMLPGLVERLEKEMTKLVPSATQVRVHAAPNRHHAAFLGAMRLADLPQFESQCVTRREWADRGKAAVREKWLG